MRVRELIAILQKHDPELEVFLPIDDAGWLEAPDPVVLDVLDQIGAEGTDPAPRVVFPQPGARRALVLRDPEF